MTVRRWVSQYTVTAVPEGHRWADDRHFQITVERCLDDGNLWSVHHGLSRALNTLGHWGYTADGAGLWPLNVALLYAERAAPDVAVNGMRAGDIQ